MLPASRALDCGRAGSSATKIRCRIKECGFASSSGRQIESLTLAVTAFSPKKLKKFVLLRHGFSVPRLPEKTRYIMFWVKPQRGGDSSVL